MTQRIVHVALPGSEGPVVEINASGASALNAQVGGGGSNVLDPCPYDHDARRDDESRERGSMRVQASGHEYHGEHGQSQKEEEPV